MLEHFKSSTTYRPFKFPWAVEATQEHEIALHWHEKEVNLQQDIQQWKENKISEPEKQFITNVLRLFTQSDVAVGDAYKTDLIPYLRNNEISNMLTSFANRESVHQRAYALIPEALNFPESEWHAFLEYSGMVQKWEFMCKFSPPGYCPTELKTPYLLAKQVFMEGVSLFGSFAMLLWFKQHGKMLGTCEIVEWSLRDESLHVECNARLFRELTESGVEPEFKKTLYDLARTVVSHEDAFIESAFALFQPEGLSEQSMKKYIRYLADRRLIQLGLKGNWKQKQLPEELQYISWVTSAPRSANFFERRVTDYQDSGMTGEIDWSVYRT